MPLDLSKQNNGRKGNLTGSTVQEIANGTRRQSTWTRASVHVLPDNFSDTSLSDDETGSVVAPEPGSADSDHAVGDDEVITESKDLHLSINEAIGSLMRLSTHIHLCSRKPKFFKLSMNESYAVDPEIRHVQDLFPRLRDTGNGKFADKLGKANAQRRYWVQYRRRHEQLLYEGFDPVRQPVIIPSEEVVRERAGPAAQFDGTRATAARIKQRLLAPKPPESSSTSPQCFCRYCCTFVELPDKQAWRYVAIALQICEIGL